MSEELSENAVVFWGNAIFVSIATLLSTSTARWTVAAGAMRVKSGFLVYQIPIPIPETPGPPGT